MPADHRTSTEKLSQLHFFFHDIFSGKTPSAVKIISSPPKAKSATASQSDIAFLVAVNFVFTEGKYNGSTISILGRNLVLNDAREMPIVGGSGLFQFTHGYALAHTVWFDPKTGDAIVEYNVFVLHY
ncbi:hypothetical protein L484_008610 [Morus notabilis]|uniref:Dirigent protein n=1 Tax=Morus notabilis TaxID=981085 RepID=W9S210_9ROSA|nr:hypothetical protein L484_008610 [Morus notabilis]